MTDSEAYCRNTSDGSLVWSYSIDYLYSASSVRLGAQLYVKKKYYDEFLVALNSDGTLAWSIYLGWLGSLPAIGNKLYAGCEDRLYCLNTDSSLVWSYIATDGYLGESPALDADEKIYLGTAEFGSADSKFQCYTSDGKMLWSYTVGSEAVYGAFIGPDGTVYCGNSDGNLYAFSDYTPTPTPTATP